MLACNHQSIALPSGNRTARPLWKRRVKIFSEGDNAGVMNHFSHDHHMFAGLNQLHIVVVGAGDERRPRAIVDNTPIVQGSCLGARAVASHLLHKGITLTTAGVQRRQSAVRRVINQRSTPIRNSIITAFIPEFIVRNNTGWIARSSNRVDNQITILASILIGRPLGCFFSSECGLSASSAGRCSGVIVRNV